MGHYSLAFYPENFCEVRAVQCMVDRHHTGGRDEFPRCSVLPSFWAYALSARCQRGVVRSWVGPWPRSRTGSRAPAARSTKPTRDMVSPRHVRGRFPRSQAGGSGLFDLIDEEGVCVMSACSYSFSNVHDAAFEGLHRSGWRGSPLGVEHRRRHMSHQFHVEEGLLEEARRSRISDLGQRPGNISASAETRRSSVELLPLPEDD